LLLEPIPLAGIARVTGVSGRVGCSRYVNDKYKQRPHRVEIKKASRPFNY
jgi:hypothetical protein